jgi:hypothetical protein
LSEDFEPEWVTYSSDYPDAHRRYEIEWRIAHVFDLGPDLRMQLSLSCSMKMGRGTFFGAASKIGSGVAGRWTA